jgi:hypothetical protein
MALYELRTYTLRVGAMAEELCKRLGDEVIRRRGEPSIQ